MARRHSDVFMIVFPCTLQMMSAWLCHYEYRKGQVSSGVTFLFWLLTLICNSFTLRTFSEHLYSRVSTFHHYFTKLSNYEGVGCLLNREWKLRTLPRFPATYASNISFPFMYYVRCDKLMTNHSNLSVYYEFVRLSSVIVSKVQEIMFFSVFHRFSLDVNA